MKLRESGHEASETILMQVCSRVEVVWISISSPEDYFYYLHWNKAIVQRELCTAEGYWCTVRGIVEPWEQLAFFPEDTLMQYPSYARFHPAEAKPIGDTDILSGSRASISAKDAWNCVVTHYGLLA